MALPTSKDDLLLLHNPKCSKSRATRDLLEERGVDFRIRLYLEDPLDRGELAELAARLGKPAIGFTRTGQAEFAEAGLDPSSPDDAVLAAMAGAPILMERPILVRGDRAAIGRPPENVLQLLDPPLGE
ncbi:MAG TPA: arsenate reductase (glutaredoxin) [Deltaproteobacteria bacterium]|nr:arsenate reductase (glutaredoxin) [Deltaproteobacteria bacterium]